MSAKNAIFDGWDFAAHGLTIHTLDMYTRTPKQIQLEELAVEDGGVQVTSRYAPKPITIEGKIQTDTVDLLEAAIDDLLLGLSGDLRTLDIPHAGDTRRFIATAQNVAIGRGQGGATIASFSAEFIVPSGFGSDLTPLTLINQTITTQSTDLAMTVGGSYKAQPDITLTINSITDGGPNKSLNLFNPATTEGITITRAWVAGDSLTFNARDRQIYLNNTQIYAKGAFPSWQPGSQYLSYFDDFTARDVSILATYTRRWL